MLIQYFLPIFGQMNKNQEKKLNLAALRNGAEKATNHTVGNFFRSIFEGSQF